MGILTPSCPRLDKPHKQFTFIVVAISVVPSVLKDCIRSCDNCFTPLSPQDVTTLVTLLKFVHMCLNLDILMGTDIIGTKLGLNIPSLPLLPISTQFEAFLAT